MRRSLPSLAPLFATVVVAGGCPVPGDPCAAVSSDTGESVSVDVEPAYGGDGNDEVWVTLQDAGDRATTGGDAATVLVPAADQVFVQNDAIPVFSWESPLQLAQSAPPAALWRPAARSLVERAATSLSAVLIPPARAHLAPVSGDAYLVEIRVPGRQCPVSIVTTEVKHTLDARIWDALAAAAGEDLSLTITSAYLQSGRVAEGPFLSDTVHFRVE